MYLEGIPASCADDIMAYNEAPNIAQLNSVYGAATMYNDTCVAMTNVPYSVMYTFQTTRYWGAVYNLAVANS